MYVIAWIVTLTIAYFLGVYRTERAQQAKEQQWLEDCATGTPIAAQVARDMGLTLKDVGIQQEEI